MTKERLSKFEESRPEGYGKFSYSGPILCLTVPLMDDIIWLFHIFNVKYDSPTRNYKYDVGYRFYLYNQSEIELYDKACIDIEFDEKLEEVIKS